MTKLPFDCSYTDVWVSPPNWRTISAKSAQTKAWYVQCYYYDPRFKDKYPNGKPYRKKLNKFKDLEIRREAIKILLQEIPKLFSDKGYNPITGEYRIEQKQIQCAIHSDLNFTDAFSLAASKVPGSKNHCSEVRIAINRFNKKALILGHKHTKIRDLRYGLFSDILDSLNLTDNSYNKFRAYFIAVFKVLRKHECCTVNLAQDLDKKKTVSRPREALSCKRLDVILENLKQSYYSFYRYAKIFFYSGTRSTELFSVKFKDVRIEDQEYDVLVLKGNQSAWETKVILKNALGFWRELINESTSADDYIFSNDLKPGMQAINPKQITRRWRRHVKLKLAFFEGQLFEINDLEKRKISNYKNVTEDFYSIKHTFLDMLDQMQSSNNLVSSDISKAIAALDVDDATKALLLANLSPKLDFDAAQRMAAHKTVAITNKVYKVNKARRDNEMLKNLDIK